MFYKDWSIHILMVIFISQRLTANPVSQRVRRAGKLDFCLCESKQPTQLNGQLPLLCPTCLRRVPKET